MWMGTTESRNTKAIYISPIFFEWMNRRAISKNQQSTAVFLHLFLTLKHSSIVLSRKSFAAVGVIEVNLKATHWTCEKQKCQKIISHLRSTQQRRKIYCETPSKSWLIQALKKAKNSDPLIGELSTYSQQIWPSHWRVQSNWNWVCLSQKQNAFTGHQFFCSAESKLSSKEEVHNC